MIKNLYGRLIIFNILVIGGVIAVLFLIAYVFNPPTENSHRYLYSFLLIISLIFISSVFIAIKAMKPVKEAWQKQLAFTAEASHELRTPLTVIRANLELILSQPQQTVESQSRWLQNILFENNRLSRLTDDLLTLARADSNIQELDLELFLLDETITEIVKSFHAVATPQNITIETDLKPVLECFGDKNRLKQLISILLDNAIQYSASGIIKVIASRQANYIEITVTDQGRGIAPDEQAKIFERFYRTVEAKQINNRGSGLGLSIARWIINAHKGTIEVRSQPNQGSVFSVRLPQ